MFRYDHPFLDSVLWLPLAAARGLFRAAEWLGKAIAHHGPRGSLDFSVLHMSAGVYSTDNGEFKLGLSVVPYEFIMSPLGGIHLDLGWFKVAVEWTVYRRGD